MRLAAITMLMREQLDMVERAAMKASRCPVSVEPYFVDELLPGVTVEQVIARMLLDGASANVLAGAIGLPMREIHAAVKALACGAHVDWTPPRLKRRA